MRYNIYIQQLRGISIIFIILYHFSKLRNGYLSVSIFLQISGYINIFVSTNRKYNIGIFFYKRVITIFPQLYVVVVIILLYTVHISYNRLLNLYSEIIALIKMRCNNYFYEKEMDYFSQYDNPSYILHFWYISLLQQIYIINPLLLYIYFYHKSIMHIITLTSFSIFFYNISYKPDFAYYLMISRIYEYMLGIYSNTNIKIFSYSKILQNVAMYTVIIIQSIDLNIHIIFKFVVINISAYCIIRNIHLNCISKEFILNNCIVYAIGNISYELYLIHYPFIQKYNSSNSFILLLYLYAIAYLLSLIKFINQKFLFLISIILPILVIIYIKRKKRYYIVKLENLIIAPKIHPNKEYHIIFKRIKNYYPLKNKKQHCMLLLGDSHLQQWFPSIIKIAKIKNYGIIDIYFHADIIENGKYKSIIKSLEVGKNITTIIISSFFMSGKWIVNISLFKNSFHRYIISISNYCKYIFIIDDIPYLHSNPLNCVYSEMKSRKCYAIMGINASITLLPFIKSKNLKYCNMNKYICTNKIIQFVKNGIIVYKDTNHLTLSFSYTLTNYLNNCLTI